MYQDLMKRLVVVCGLLVAGIAFVINLVNGADMLHAAFMALCVMFAASTVIMVAFQTVAQVLFKHLEERRRVQRMMAENEFQTEQKKLHQKTH